MQKWNTIFNNSTIITLNKPTLDMINLTKFILQICFVQIFFEFTNIKCRLYFNINWNCHICLYFSLPQPTRLCLWKSFQKNELICNSSIKSPLIQLTAMQRSIHLCQNISGNKWIQTRKKQNYQVNFFVPLLRVCLQRKSSFIIL